MTLRLCTLTGALMAAVLLSGCSEPIFENAGSHNSLVEDQQACAVEVAKSPAALAQSDTGIRDMKAVADTLVYLGVISRWIRNEEATLFAGCRLLNDFITAEGNNSCRTT